MMPGLGMFVVRLVGAVLVVVGQLLQAPASNQRKADAGS